MRITYYSVSSDKKLSCFIRFTYKTARMHYLHMRAVCYPEHLRQINLLFLSCNYSAFAFIVFFKKHWTSKGMYDIIIKRNLIRQYFDAWLSLVERCVRDAEVAGSNPVASTPWQGRRDP